MPGPRTHHPAVHTVVALVLAISVLLAPRLALAQRAARPAPPVATAGRGWANPEALALAKEGIEAKKNGDLQLCLTKDQASLALENHPYVRLHISSCYAALHRYKDALVAARDSLAAAIKNDDDDLKKAALARVQEVIQRIGRLKIEFPDHTENLKITLNGQTLRPQQVQTSLTVDPGEYTLEASKVERGVRYYFKDSVTVGEGEEKTIEVLPKKDQLEDDTESCLKKAKSYRERLKCVEEVAVHPNVHVGLEISGYTDSFAVSVFSPSINAAVDSPTGGWNVGGSYLLDVVSGASPDLVSTASAAYKEQRHAVSLSGGYKFSRFALEGHGNLSSEPDYFSKTIGVAATTELNEKLITPRLGYALQADTIGYRNTTFANYPHSLTVHHIEMGVTFVMSPTTLLVTGLSLELESGENAKLYRFIPMFSESDVKLVQPGLTATAVNEKRLNFRPREQVPDARNRVAIGGRLNHRFPFGTLRVEERLYTDNWGVKASSSDGRFLYDLSDRLRVWPHARLHVQSGASFYQLAYAASVSNDGQLDIPQYRTGKREESPMAGISLGGGGRISLTSEKATTRYAVIVSGDFMYDRYFASLYVLSRTAVYGTVGFDAEF